jgi:hypothetical protein
MLARVDTRRFPRRSVVREKRTLGGYRLQRLRLLRERSGIHLAAIAAPRQQH